ncbi:MAG: DUF928 domain-containing protein [Spirulina sp. SIO3F2]|nr:DUF928 domain-containing protein [Spirulina sp. SIO3F2]
MLNLRLTGVSTSLILIATLIGGSEGFALAPKPEGGVAFKPPNLDAPDNTTDGGTRGEVLFSPTNRGAPDNTTDGGTRGEVLFTPTERSAPDNTTDGGSRGDSQLPDDLQLLVPPTVMPLTLSEKPTFFAYIPHLPAQAVKFTLYRHDADQLVDEQLIHEVQIPMPERAGIVRFTLPDDQRIALEPNQLYHWYVSLVLDPQDASGNIVAESWVKRLSAEDPVVLGLNQSPSPDYAQAGLWYEALAQQVQTHQFIVDPSQSPASCMQGDNLDDWSRFLQSVELCNVVAAPLLN